MDREQVFSQIEATFGFVPRFLRSVPDSSLEIESLLMNRVQLAEGPVANKYRELIGVALASTAKCDYCIFFHAELAKLNGATYAEIEDAMHFVKGKGGVTAWMERPKPFDVEQSRREVQRAFEHFRAQQAAQESATH